LLQKFGRPHLKNPYVREMSALEEPPIDCRRLLSTVPNRVLEQIQSTAFHAHITKYVVKPIKITNKRYKLY